MAGTLGWDTLIRMLLGKQAGGLQGQDYLRAPARWRLCLPSHQSGEWVILMTSSSFILLGLSFSINCHARFSRIQHMWKWVAVCADFLGSSRGGRIANDRET